MNTSLSSDKSSLVILTFYLLMFLRLLNAELDNQLIDYILKQYPNIEVLMQIPSHCRGLAKENLLKCSFDDDCGRQHCHNHGYCISYRFRDIEANIPHALCLCDPGWTGSSCKDDEDECKLFKPCRKRSICQNTVGSYKCVCDNNDSECNQQFNYGCNENSCLNGGVCKDYACECASGWSGQQCESRDQQSISQAYLSPSKKLLVGRISLPVDFQYNPITNPYSTNPFANPNGYQYPVNPISNQNPINPVAPYYPQGSPFNNPGVLPQNPAVVPNPVPASVQTAAVPSRTSATNEKSITVKKSGPKNYTYKILSLIIIIFILVGIGTGAALYFFKRKWFLLNKPRFHFPPDMPMDDSFKYMKSFNKRKSTQREKLLSAEDIDTGGIYAQPAKSTPNDGIP